MDYPARGDEDMADTPHPEKIADGQQSAEEPLSSVPTPKASFNPTIVDSAEAPPSLGLTIDQVGNTEHK